MSKRIRGDWRVFVLVALLLSFLAACKPADVVSAPKDSLVLRVAMVGDCPTCERVPYSPNGQMVVSLKLNGVIAKAEDVESVTKSVDGDKAQIRLTFKAGARPQVLDASSAAVGQMCAWIVDGKAVNSVAIASPFSDEVVVSGLSKEGANRLFDAVSQHK